MLCVRVLSAQASSTKPLRDKELKSSIEAPRSCAKGQASSARVLNVESSKFEWFERLIVELEWVERLTLEPE